MIIIGIDFSMNSPGLCILKDSKYEFVSFFNSGTKDWESVKNLKRFYIHKELIDLNIITPISYTRFVNSTNFIEREREKLIDANNISQLILDFIKSNSTRDVITIGLEGFSYGSSGNSFIDIIIYNSFLRFKLMNEFGPNNITISQPTYVKKLAGKGNANKIYMFNAFKKNVLNDRLLTESKFWEWVQDKEYDTAVPSPISDLIDSYFILKSTEF